MNCGYKVKINGSENFFDSDKMLDQWVEENYFLNPKNLERLQKYIKGKAYIFDSADPQTIALQTIDKITESLKNRTDIRIGNKYSAKYEYDAETDTLTLDVEGDAHYDRLVGVTTYINTTGNRVDYRKEAITASNSKKYEEYLKENIRQKLLPLRNSDAHKNESDDAFEAFIRAEQNIAVDQYRKKCEYAQLGGEDVHHMFEQHAREKMHEAAKITPGYVFTKDDQEAFKDETKKIFDNICKRYKFSDDAVFLPEFEIFGEHITPSIREFLKDKLGKSNLDGVYGRIDLLVIDKGKVYVFDYKSTAGKEVGDWQEMDNKVLSANNWWPSTKKIEAMEQIAMYLAILESWGFEVGGGEVIPITIEWATKNDLFDVKTNEISVDGKKIKQAPQEDGVRNVVSLKLDTSTDSIPETEQARRSSSYRILNTYLPWARNNVCKIKPLEIKELTDVSNDMEFMFPIRTTTHKQEFQVNVNFYLGKDADGKSNGKSRIVPIPSNYEERAKGFSYMMYTSPKVDLRRELTDSGNTDLIAKYDIKNSPGSPIFFKSNSEEEVRPILEIYCRTLNKVLTEEFNSFATGLKNVMQIGGRDHSQLIEEISKFVGKDPSRQEFVINLFKPYMDGNWLLYGAEDPSNEYIQNGIFIFYNNDILEVVALSHDPLHYEVNFGTNRHPLKSIVNGLHNKPEDPWNTLSSSKGNMLLMKVMDIISKDPNIYRNGETKIRNILVANPWQQKTCWADNDKLLSNWTRLCSLSGGRLTAVSKSAFVSSKDAAIHKAQEILMTTSMWASVGGMFQNESKDEKTLVGILNLLKNKNKNAFNDDGTPKIDTEVGYAAYCILNAMLIDRKLRIPIEHDTGKILEGGLLPVGAFMQSPGNAKSVTIRTLDVLTAYFREMYSNLKNNWCDSFNEQLQIIYDEYHYNPNITPRRKFWEKFFEKDSKGNVAPQMRIISFSDSFWDKQPAKVKAAFKYILDQLAVFKNIQTTEESPLPEMADPAKYYEMPLTKGRFIDSIKKGAKSNGLKGIWDVITDRVKDLKNKAETLYFGDEELYLKGNDDSEDLLKVLSNHYCVYDESDREKLCERKDVSYSTDLEEILGVALTAQAITESSRIYGPLYAAVKCLLAANEKLGGEAVPELADYVEKYITKNYKGKSIMDESVKTLAGLIGVAKGVTSKMTLGFSTRAFTREMLVSLYTGALRSNNFKINGITGEDFWFGLSYVLKQAPANIKKQTLIGLLNKRYGMAGQSRSELAKTGFISDFGLRTIDMDNLTYLGTTLPDNYFRMAILIARLHADGALDAYSVDNDNRLHYDPKKDKRFAKYLTDGDSPMFKQYEASMGKMGDYLEAQSLWNSYLEEWQQLYPNENITTLPEAYPPHIHASIRQDAGKLYGFFDDETKSLMTYQLIGSSIMQYKTWLSAKIDQWLKRPGFTNIWQRVHKRDENGNPLYVLAHTTDEIASGTPAIEFITEDKITQEMIKEGRISPYIVEEGMFDEGMVQSTVSFAEALLTMNFDEFRNMWQNDPVARGNFICGLIDMWGMMLFAGLIKLLFGEDVVNNRSAQNWITQWSYGVLMGFAEDGPIHQVLGSMVGDWNPPALLTMKRLAQTTKSVIVGNKTLPQGFVESFGATKEFSGFFKQ